MGLFADYAQEFYDIGLQPVPIEPESKICRIHKSDIHFFYKRLTQNSLDKWIKSHGHWDIGIACGHVSGVIGVDFDYQGENWQDYERLLIGDLEPCFIIKKGQKGWTRFYKYNSNVKNAGIDKNGQRFVDILSDGKVTVMPPTPHKSGDIYRYLTPDTFQDIAPNELKTITPEHVLRIRKLAEKQIGDLVGNEVEKDPEKRRNRHMTLFKKVLNLATQFSDINFIADRLIAFDYEVHSIDEKGPYFKDSRYLGSKKAFDVATEFVNRVIEWKRSKMKSDGMDWDVGERDLNFWIEKEDGKLKRSNNSTDYSTFFDIFLNDARREYFTDIIYYKKQRVRDGNIEQFYQAVENNFDLLQGMARTAGLVQNHVKTEFAKWAEKQECKYLIDFVPWDGRDHIGELLKHITFKNIEHKFATDLFRQWLATVWMRAKNPKIQNTCVLLSGHQGVGKDYFVSFMLSALGDYYSEIAITENKIENYKAVDSLLVGYIPEFDESARVPISTIKSFITVEKAKFRVSYGHRAEIFSFKHSLISSANFDFLLKDSSGNRRFWLFEIDQIDWSYTKNCNPDQIMAQAIALSEQGYRASNKALNAMRDVIESETPDDEKDLLLLQVNQIIHEKQQNMLEAKQHSFKKSENRKVVASRQLDLNDMKVRWPMIADDVSKLSRQYRVSVKMIQQLLKKRGVSRIDRYGPFYNALSRENVYVLKNVAKRVENDL